MEDFRLDILARAELGDARAVSIPLPRHTIIGATTGPGMLPRPLRDRFGLDVRLELYSLEDLAAVVERSAAMLGMPIGPGVAMMVAVRSRGTPRIANRLLRPLRDWAWRGEGVIDELVAEAAFGFLGVDDQGLDARDRRYLQALRGRDRPVGVRTLAAIVGEEVGTVEEGIEPWLIACGMVKRTPGGGWREWTIVTNAN